VHYEAVVTGLLPNGKAEVLIQPDKPGIPNAPAISARVCHCASNSSMVRIEALNRAEAEVGDWVSVSHKTADIMKNVCSLIGTPLAGLIAGVALGNLWGGTALAISCLVGTLLGIVIGVLAYRRLSKNNLPVIERVIQSRKELAAMYTGRSNAGKDQVGCQEGCTSCLP
jgi:hypothetical protein